MGHRYGNFRPSLAGFSDFKESLVLEISNAAQLVGRTGIFYGNSNPHAIIRIRKGDGASAEMHLFHPDIEELMQRARIEYGIQRKSLLQLWASLPGQSPVVSKYAEDYLSPAYDGPHIRALEQITGTAELNRQIPMRVEGSTFTYTADHDHFYRIHFYSKGAALNFLRSVNQHLYKGCKGIEVVSELKHLGIVHPEDEPFDLPVYLESYDNRDQRKWQNPHDTIAVRGHGNEIYGHIVPESGEILFTKMMNGLAHQGFARGLSVLELAHAADGNAVLDFVVKGQDAQELAGHKEFGFNVRAELN